MRETEGESASLQAAATPSLDLIFELLSNKRRRYVLYYLNEQPNGVATMDELAEGVLTYERRVTGGDQSDHRQQIRIELRHVHVPKLAANGLVDHDRRTETVRYWTQPSLTEWLEHAHHKELL